jgi:hypothetical protein
MVLLLKSENDTFIFIQKLNLILGVISWQDFPDGGGVLA